MEEETEQPNKRSELNIQKFMDDMRMLGEQVVSKEVAKPVFNFGSLEVTNYILWNILGELQMLNDSLEEEE